MRNGVDEKNSNTMILNWNVELAEMKLASNPSSSNHSTLHFLSIFDYIIDERFYFWYE